MDDFGMLTRDFGFRPQGKSAPMKGGLGSDSGRSSSTKSSPFIDEQNTDDLLFTGVFGGPPKYASQGSKASSTPDFDYDSIFRGSSATSETKSKSSGPVYDKPVYDEDIFGGLPGLKHKSMSSSSRFDENVFASMASPPKQSDHFDDLLGNLGRNKSSRGFDDLLPGFGSGSPTVSNRTTSESKQPRPSSSSNKKGTDSIDDPFVILVSTSTARASSPGFFSDPLEEISNLSKPGIHAKSSSASGGMFGDIDPLENLGKTIPIFSPEIEKKVEEEVTTKEQYARSSIKYSDSHKQKKMPLDDVEDSRETPFDIPTASTDSPKSFAETGYSHSYGNVNGSQADMSPKSEENVYVQQYDDVWLYVSEVPLFTQPTSAPAPSRPPPPIPGRNSRSESLRKKGSEFSSRNSQSRNPFDQPPKSSVSSIDELEAFAMGSGSTQNPNENGYAQSDAAASAAAMKDAMDRAEAKFKHAKEVRGREYVKSVRTKEAVQLPVKDENPSTENQDELLERRQREEEEREMKRAEKEKAARLAVERATREARERAAAESLLKSERAAAESRLKTERAAVQRAQAEARERAAADARGRAERAAAEARERSNAEAKERATAVARAEAEARRQAERATVNRVAAEARERAATGARDRAAAAAAAAKTNNEQKKNDDDDLESFFSSRANSVPRPRTSNSDPVPEPQFQNRGPEVAKRTSSTGAPSNMRKASSATNIDDLTSLFGGGLSSGDFPDIDGETEERRRARLDRHQRTQERAAKALAEKNHRDLQVQKDQEERHRIADTLDIEIKRWAAGKEGNLRALLSTLQYVLWPECGWQAVSLTDLITGASVKKVYRKATLCIHPDKVQQKGASLQQKYVAEKVFDLLKEAWNKFNSEELF